MGLSDDVKYFVLRGVHVCTVRWFNVVAERGEFFKADLVATYTPDFAKDLQKKQSEGQLMEPESGSRTSETPSKVAAPTEHTPDCDMHLQKKLSEGHLTEPESGSTALVTPCNAHPTVHTPDVAKDLQKKQSEGQLMAPASPAAQTPDHTKGQLTEPESCTAASVTPLNVASPVRTSEAVRRRIPRKSPDPISRKAYALAMSPSSPLHAVTKRILIMPNDTNYHGGAACSLPVKEKSKEISEGSRVRIVSESLSAHHGKEGVVYSWCSKLSMWLVAMDTGLPICVQPGSLELIDDEPSSSCTHGFSLRMTMAESVTTSCDECRRELQIGTCAFWCRMCDSIQCVDCQEARSGASPAAASATDASAAPESAADAAPDISESPKGRSQPDASPSRTASGAPAERTVNPHDSLRETVHFLEKEQREEYKASPSARLLDCAIQLYRVPRAVEVEDTDPLEAEAPEDVLGVRQGASAEEIRTAYRERALVAHPDKGGDVQAFCRLRRAYLALSTSSAVVPAVDEGQLQLPNSCVQMKDHRALVKAKFEEDGCDLKEALKSMRGTLNELGLVGNCCGETNTNEEGKEMSNQCFYLAMAGSYLGRGKKSEGLHDTALSLKRVIEAAVLAAHPDWAGNTVGEDIQAFSDFLFFVLSTNALLSETAVAIFDSVSGFVEIFKGRAFPDGDREMEQRANTLTMQYVPGHYKALLPKAKSRRPSLAQIVQSLDAHNVRYVITEV
eukprot:TRINITY_DN2545_c0_g1_i1.p1 TRINITY_DN2545_c0_g1~~TRINITY_DN2545_c0_g1_i1.p1  ORF type:complete len:838 (+),score=172.06 TRINITY_DN2545_c0_g1_i1:320-2515(+)